MPLQEELKKWAGPADIPTVVRFGFIYTQIERFTFFESVHREYPKNEFVTMGIEIAKHHHEKWDGSGYPDGLSGEAIPLSARIMALVDVYDALRSRRPYKKPFSHEKSTAIIVDLDGSHFDPRIVEMFVRIEDQFAVTHAALMDDAPDESPRQAG